MENIFSARFDKYEPRRDNLPRVLLRGWHPGTAAAALGLNTGRGIYPFAWQCLLPASNTRVSREPPSLPSRLTELSRPAVTALAQSHIGSQQEVATPFTSWTADLSTAVFFALGSFGHVQWEMNDAPGYIAVVDSSRPRPVIHVPDLGWQSLPQEYLIYGPVTEGIRVVSIAAIRNIINCQHWPFCHSVRREPHAVTEEEIRDSVRVGLLFLGPTDKHVDVVLVIAASLLSWAQVRVLSPRPLGPAELARAERQQTRPWPQPDLDTILGSRLLVHKGAVPPLSGALLGNALTSTSAWEPARDTAETSPPVLTRAQWVAAFKAAANWHSPVPHDCGPIRCEFCGKVGATATDWLKLESIYFCSQQCYDSQAKKERAEGNQNSVKEL
ncbi:hypothetical protein INS49_014560 [Diaporthe citri]|uniref:uncharacterized protein n=1 Tax=Diaporthe citri TaxID=83186 RepID=UPI001C814CF0|nr:uncharacterized protein INS49_014560 [Diaporthe citri]KAG6356686.1 hypothetical protein INS49_014560 [Diaporthe citri]